MSLTDDEKRKLGRAIWSYTGKDQRNFAEAAGVKYDRLRGMLNDPTKSPPSTDELVLMSEAAGIPVALAVHGWVIADPVARLQDHVGRLRVELEDQQAAYSDLNLRLASLTADVARHTREIQELRGTGRQTGSSEDAPR